MTKEEMEELNGLAASMGLYDDKNPCKRAVILGKAIKALEQEPRWIPVSERLPEEREWYLAVFKERDTDYQLIPRVADYIGENNWRIIDGDGLVKEYRDILECVAWMPLPEPYQGERRGVE